MTGRLKYFLDISKNANEFIFLNTSVDNDRSSSLPYLRRKCCNIYFLDEVTFPVEQVR
jgi:hypothetical protein